MYSLEDEEKLSELDLGTWPSLSSPVHLSLYMPGISQERLTADIERMSTDDTATAPKYLSGFRLWISMVSLILSIFLIALDMTIVATSIPAITKDFKGIQDQAWYAAAFFLTTGGFQSTWGKVYQNFPLKISFLTAIVIFEIGSLICAVAPSSRAFIVGRAIAGLGSAGVGSGSYTIVAFIAEPKKRANLTSILGAIFGVGSVLGPLVGGAFSSSVSWRWCFYINLPIGIPPVVGILFFLRLPEIARPRKATLKDKLLQMDPLGLLLLLGGIVMYLLAVQYGGAEMPWSSATVIGLLVGCIVCFILFGFAEYWQGERAAIIPRLFKERFVGVSMIYIAFQGGALFATVYYLPLYFQAILGDSAVIAGVRNLAFIVPAMASVLVSGVIATNTGLITLVVTVGSAIATVGCGLCYLFDIHSSTGLWVGVQIVAGVGLGLGFQVPLSAAQASVAEVDLAAVTAMMLEFQNLGGAIWVSAAQSVFVNRLLIGLSKSTPGVDPQQVIASGAGELRNVFDPAQLPGILEAYSTGIQDAYLLICAVAGVSTLVAIALPWKRTFMGAK